MYQLCLLLAVAIPPAEMRDLVATRLSLLDRITCDVEHHVYTCPIASDLFDRAGWVEYEQIPDYRHVTIVRPAMLDVDLRDAPDLGYVPVRYSVGEHGMVSQHVRPHHDGYTVYTVSQHAVQAGVSYHVYPLLQVFDFHLQDCPVQSVNLLRLFDEYGVVEIGAGDGYTTYAATVDGESYFCEYEFDLNERGTPLRITAWLRRGENAALMGAWEMHVLDTVEINGAEFPRDVVATVSNLENPRVSSHYGVHHFVMSNVAIDPSLDLDDVLIVPELRKAHVHYAAAADGLARSCTYDEDGQLVDTVVFDGTSTPEYADSDGRVVSREVLQWRRYIPWAGALAGVIAIAALRFVAGRVHRR